MLFYAHGKPLKKIIELLFFNIITIIHLVLLLSLLPVEARTHNKKRGVPEKPYE